jgi:alpha-L-rhamnosidase
MGDADLSAQSMLLNFDCSAFYTMFMDNMDSEEDKDGSLTDVVPLVRYGGRPADPSWSAAFIEVGYQLWKSDGSTAVPKQHWAKMMLHLQEYANLAAKSSSKWPPTKYGDWVPAPFPEGLKISGGPKPVKPYTSAYAWITNLREMAAMATAMGDTASATKFNGTVAGLVKQWNSQWLNANNTYANKVQTTYTLPINLGIIPAASQKAVSANFLADITASKDHMTTGIIGGKAFFFALDSIGAKATATAVLEKTDYPSYGYMAKNTLEPATENLWELMDAPYEGTGMNSRNHHMWSAVSTYLVKSVGECLRMHTPVKN